MAGTIRALIDFFRDALSLPSLEIVIDENFRGGKGPLREARLAFRTRIAEELGLSGDARARALDLEQPLVQVGVRFLSISHDPQTGGYAIADRPLGFDLEQPERVEKAVVQRIAPWPGEATAAPRPAWLWSAKECAFKCLRHAEQRPQTLSQLEIGDWRISPEGSLSGTFRVKNLSDFSSRDALGAIVEESARVHAVFAFLA